MKRKDLELLHDFLRKILSIKDLPHEKLLGYLQDIVNFCEDVKEASLSKSIVNREDVYACFAHYLVKHIDGEVVMCRKCGLNFLSAAFDEVTFLLSFTDTVLGMSEIINAQNEYAAFIKSVNNSLLC